MPFELIVVGTSLGGLNALSVLLSALPTDFPLPVVLAPHRGKDRFPSLADCLSERTSHIIEEPDDKAPIIPGHVYMAPADYHLMIDNDCLALSTEAPVHHCRPSIDVLFQSASEHFGNRVAGVILTGSNDDGALGARTIEERGGLVIVQDPRDAEACALPNSVLLSTKHARVMPLLEIAPYLVSVAAIRT